jgi:hypothetical protein
VARPSYLTLALVMVAFGGCTGGTAGGDDTAGTAGTAGTTGTDSDGDTETGGDDTPEATALPIEILGPAGTVVAVSIDVPDDLADTPGAALALTVHNVVEADAMFVVVGDAAAPCLGINAPPAALAGPKSPIKRRTDGRSQRWA